MTKAFTLMPWAVSFLYRLQRPDRFAYLAFLHQPLAVLGSSYQPPRLADPLSRRLAVPQRKFTSHSPEPPFPFGYIPRYESGSAPEAARSSDTDSTNHPLDPSTLKGRCPLPYLFSSSFSERVYCAAPLEISARCGHVFICCASKCVLDSLHLWSFRPLLSGLCSVERLFGELGVV